MTETKTVRALRFRVLGTENTLQFENFTTIVAGYTGRDEAAVRHHIDELAAIGVAPPAQVPMLYTMNSDTTSVAENVEIDGHNTSGEVEPVILRHSGKYFLGVGSDHTDRDLETIDIADSKRACPKPLCSNVIEIPDWESFEWDSCTMRSWVDGKLYQEGTLANLRTPTDLLGILAERHSDDGNDLICFAGTLPLLDGEFTPGHRWALELTIPDGRTLSHTYTTSEGH
ncbi:DUF2848 family protein [Rhodococcus erythropolis]|uniref:DUF2848 family protein n=1 Tax=Rhodococcus TaxID=1827 RepID=UPI000DBFA771|nr:MULTISPECIES: DUF2848 family protein [Rhodococcus]MDV6208075.1 DUF2848 family protein [Rhodococcus erythropolis]RAL33771.1 DUF2848 domain-containing protein [Rhodococcus sp. AQ5-07]